MNRIPISEVYNTDCVPFMREYPDKFFDLAICDPPYGIGITNHKSGMGRRKGNEKARYKIGNWDNEIPTTGYFTELFRVSKNQIIWGGNYFDLPPTKCFLIWDKLFSNEVSFAACEYAWTSFCSTAKIFKLSTQQQNRIHPMQKPISLYEWLLKSYAKQGDTILDTHLGSGSSRIAAQKLGFDFYGCEIDKDYFEQSEKRFKEAISMPLFDSAASVQQQLVLV